MDVVAVKATDARIPRHHDRVYKDECTFCFATAESEGGLYVNLSTFQAACKEHLPLDQKRSGGVLYLHQHAHRVPLTVAQAEAQRAEPDKLAIGMQGGFDVTAKKYTVETDCAVVVATTGDAFPLPCPDLPEQVLASVAAIQMHDSANARNQVEAWQDERVVSKYAAGLEQLPCTRTIPMDPVQWKCDDTGVTENLWLNLATGHIGSGRAHWDGTGGNNSALHHFEQTGKKYPLVVKLGTITPSGADVYSYAEDEDDMVLDPDLARHLSHWGINMLQMEKTEKTMAELQIQKNMAYEFDKITEAGSALHQLTGPGYVGLQNLGNSCYMNSVLQVLWSLPEVQERYMLRTNEIYESAPVDVANDFLAQFAKVGVALVQGKTCRADLAAAEHFDAMTEVFKSMIGKGHAEFSSMRQQDAQEFFSYLLDSLTRAERAGSERLSGVDTNTSNLFEFGTETRVQCLESQRVSYKEEASTLLSLEIPLEAATNLEALEEYKERQQKRQKLKSEGGDNECIPTKSAEFEERVIPRVPLSACFEKFAGDEIINGYFSSFVGRNTQASKRVRLSSFPNYLMVQLRRYYIDATWTPKKLEVLVDVPEHLSLEMLRGTGLQDGEDLQPDAIQPISSVVPVLPDEGIVAQLVTMGFPDIGSRKAATATGNSSAEAAMDWVLSHMEDPDFNVPLSTEAARAPVLDAESVALITGMGFTGRQATAALATCGGNVERAGDWLFSRMHDLDTAVNAELAKTAPRTLEAPTKMKYNDGKAEYELTGVISHMGSNTACGHYVCHIKKEGQWAIFNDEKVAVSEHPPLELGYMYLYKRV